VVNLAVIVCDTDFLIKISNDPLPKVDLKDLMKSNQLIVLPSVLQEIQGLKKNRNFRTSKRAHMADRVISNPTQFTLISPDLVNQRRSARETDYDLMEFVTAKPGERILATLDKALLSRFERRGLPYITLSRDKLFFSSSLKKSNIFN
jgi:rRNA-processing protein FCF1